MHQNIEIPENKQEAYDLLIAQTKAIIESESDTIANLANVSSIIYEFLHDVNWVGFYLVKDTDLVVGPFQGKVACSRIALYKGVCGRAVENKEMVNIANVHAFEGHIACDSASNSEIVFPLIINNNVIGVLDIDSPSLNRFDELDEKNLQLLVNVLVKKLLDSH